MLKQVKIDAIMAIVIKCLSAIFLFILYKVWLLWIPYFVPDNPKAASYEQSYPVWVCVSGIILIIVTLILILNFLLYFGDIISDAVTAFLNPEAAAIKKISELIKPRSND
jgi:magnesium-transporting ATPase (P-type)